MIVAYCKDFVGGFNQRGLRLGYFLAHAPALPQV
jgi:hypothetical protein